MSKCVVSDMGGWKGMGCSWEVQGSRVMSIHMAAQAAHERNLGAVALRNCVCTIASAMHDCYDSTHTYRIDSAMLCARIDLTACLCTRLVACGGDGRAACRPLCNRYGTERGGATPLLTNPGASRQRFRASFSHARPQVYCHPKCPPRHVWDIAATYPSAPP